MFFFINLTIVVVENSTFLEIYKSTLKNLFIMRIINFVKNFNYYYSNIKNFKGLP